MSDPLDEPYRCNVGGIADRAEFRETLFGMINEAEVSAADMIAEMREAIENLQSIRPPRSRRIRGVVRVAINHGA